jgi:hypothetical protein
MVSTSPFQLWNRYLQCTKSQTELSFFPLVITFIMVIGVCQCAINELCGSSSFIDFFLLVSRFSRFYCFDLLTCLLVLRALSLFLSHFYCLFIAFLSLFIAILLLFYHFFIAFVSHGDHFFITFLFLLYRLVIAFLSLFYHLFITF